MKEIECWLKFRDMLLELDQNKITLNDILSTILKRLDELDKQDALSASDPDSLRHPLGFPRSDV